MRNKKLKKECKTLLWLKWFPSGSLGPCWWVSGNMTGDCWWNKSHWRKESRRTLSKMRLYIHVKVLWKMMAAVVASFQNSAIQCLLNAVHLSCQNGTEIVTLRKNSLLWNNYRIKWIIHLDESVFLLLHPRSVPKPQLTSMHFKMTIVSYWKDLWWQALSDSISACVGTNFRDVGTPLYRYFPSLPV